MYRTRRNPPTVQQIYDVVLATLANSDLEAYDEFQGNAKFYKQVIKKALEAKFGKLKPARKPKAAVRKPKRKKAARKRKATDGTIQLEVRAVVPGLEETQSYGMVTLPKSAVHLADFASDDATRYGLGHVQWMSIDSEHMATLSGYRFLSLESASVFIATDGHRLGAVVIDRKPHADRGALIFLPEDWREAFKSGVLLARHVDAWEDAQFPDVVPVLPDLDKAKGIYEFRQEDVDAFLAEKPRVQTNHQASRFGFHGTEVSYRYIPKHLSGYGAENLLTFPYKKMGIAGLVAQAQGLTVFNTAYVHSAFALCPNTLVTFSTLGSLSPAVLQGDQGAFAIVMPIRAGDDNNIDVRPVLPYDHPGITKWESPPQGAESTYVQTNPKQGALEKMVRNTLKVGKQGPVAITPVYVDGTMERWIMNGHSGGYTEGCIRLPSASLPEDNTQYPVIVAEDVFKGWLQLNWPTLQGVGGAQSPDVPSEAQSLIKQLNSNLFSALPFPPLRGMDKVVSDDTRYGLEYVGINEEGDLVASNGHIGILCEGLGMSRARRVGIPAELFVGKPVAVQSATYDNYAASGHQIVRCEGSYTPVNMAPLFASLKTARQTIELSMPVISQILKFKKNVNKGHGILVFGPSTKVEYHIDKTRFVTDFAGDKRKEDYTEIVMTVPFFKDFPAITGLDMGPRDKIVAVRLEFLQDLLYAMTAENKTLFFDLRQDLQPLTLRDSNSEMTAIMMPIRLSLRE